MGNEDKTNHITLGQALKKYDFIQTGGMVKYFLLENEVFVDGIPENRRGRKLYGGEVLLVNGVSVTVVNDHQ